MIAIATAKGRPKAQWSRTLNCRHSALGLEFALGHIFWNTCSQDWPLEDFFSGILISSLRYINHISTKFKLASLRSNNVYISLSPSNFVRLYTNYLLENKKWKQSIK